MPRHLISDAHEWINEIPSVPIYSPGPDRIEVEALKASYGVLSDDLLRLYNGCLQFGIFPTIWKHGAIRALLKGLDRDETLTSSYRPICLLPALGKCLEKLIAHRLEPTLLHTELSSTLQFGFRKNRSCEDAILKMKEYVHDSNCKYNLAILIDINAAFDNVWWPSILYRLKERDCPRNLYKLMCSYLKDRTVELVGKHTTVRKTVSKGCPQGSILGPQLWNLIFDNLLTTLSGTNQKIVAYADDLLIVIEGNSRAEIERRGQVVTTAIENWCTMEKLKISVGKSEMLLLKGKLDTKRPPKIRIANKQLRMVKTVRYLGVYFDEGLNIKTHIQKIKEKCQAKFNGLAKIAHRNWGLSHKSFRTLYTGLFVPIATYAAAAWSERINKTYTTQLLRTQRHALLRWTRAYCTSPTAALPVIAGVLPLDLKIMESSYGYKIRKRLPFTIGNYNFPSNEEDTPPREAVRNHLRTLWQQRWQEEEKGRHTFQLLPDVNERMEMDWIFLNHWTTQFITGHGDFAAKLSTLGLVENPNCTCGRNEETPWHVLLECPEFRSQRQSLRSHIEQNGHNWPPDKRQLLEEKTYALFASTAKDILNKKEEDRKERSGKPQPNTRGKTNR